MARRRASVRRQWADSLDTDSSLPPLLFLAVSLLLFGWTSVVIAARSTPPSLVDMMAGETTNQHRTVRLLRVAAATLAGISAAVLGISLAAGWPPTGSGSVWLVAGLIAVSTITTTVALIALDFGIRAMVKLAPDLAVRLARPKHWLSDSGPANYSNGYASGTNGTVKTGLKQTPKEICCLQLRSLRPICWAWTNTISTWCGRSAGWTTATPCTSWCHVSMSML